MYPPEEAIAMAVTGLSLATTSSLVADTRRIPSGDRSRAQARRRKKRPDSPQIPPTQRLRMRLKNALNTVRAI